MSRNFQILATSSILLLALGACGNGESKLLRISEQIGDVDIDPHQSFGEIKAALGIEPYMAEPTSRLGIGNLVTADFGYSGIAGHFRKRLVSVWFYASDASVVTDKTSPVGVVVRPPFKGRLLGVYLDDQGDDALAKVRQRIPGARLRSLDETKGWSIQLDQHTSLALSRYKKYERGHPVEPPEFHAMLHYSDDRYQIEVRSK